MTCLLIDVVSATVKRAAHIDSHTLQSGAFTMIVRIVARFRCHVESLGLTGHIDTAQDRRVALNLGSASVASVETGQEDGING